MLKTNDQLRSRLGQSLNVAQGYASGLFSAAALLDRRFEHHGVISDIRTEPSIELKLKAGR